MAKPSIEDAKNRSEEQFLGKNGVVGVGIGETATGEPCIKVYVEEKSPKEEKLIPKQLEGYKVEIEEVGELKAL
ncbi:hypothetical protein KA005_42720 [bacterium]|nr:hypothetical protein [bacterium]